MKARNTPLRKPRKAGWCCAHIIWGCSIHLRLSCQFHWVTHQHPAGLQQTPQPSHVLPATFNVLNCTASFYISASTFILLTAHNLSLGELQLQIYSQPTTYPWVNCSFKGVDIALFSAGGSISKKLGPVASDAGCTVSLPTFMHAGLHIHERCSLT